MSGESELLRQQLDKEQMEWAVERVTMRAEMESVTLETGAKLESEISAKKAAEAAAKEAIDRGSEPALQQPRVQVQLAEQGYRNHIGMSLFMSQNGMGVPKFIDGQKSHL